MSARKWYEPPKLRRVCTSAIVPSQEDAGPCTERHNDSSTSNTPLAKLTTPPIRQHFQALSSSGLAAATVSRVHRSLRARLSYAVAEGLMRTNPMAGARIPVSGKKKKQRAILTAAQAAALFAVCPESRIGPFFATLLWTGARPSEISGLTWASVNLEARELDIRQAIVRLKPTDAEKGQGVSWSLGETKTGTSRKVPIPDALVAMLRRHKVEQAAERLAAGSEFEQNDLVFCSTFGRPYHLDTVTSRYLKPLLRRAALHLAGETPLPLPPHSRSKTYLAALAARTVQEDAAIAATGFPMGVGLYSMRHSMATRLDQLGVPIKDIQEILGHADIATTLGYIQGSADRRRSALGVLEEAILPKTGKLGIA